MNILPRYLYLFQALPVEVTQMQFTTWDRIISRFIWESKRPRVKFRTLQLPKEGGGMALPKLRDYYYAAQLKYVYSWCNPNYEGKWKAIEMGAMKQPIQNFLGDKDTYEQNKSCLDVITKHTFNIWYRILKRYKPQKHAAKLKWIAYDNKFIPAKLDYS